MIAKPLIRSNAIISALPRVLVAIVIRKRYRYNTLAVHPEVENIEPVVVANHIVDLLGLDERDDAEHDAAMSGRYRHHRECCERGNPTTVQSAAPNSSGQSDRGGMRRRIILRRTRPADPASAARATVRKKASSPDKASRVAGSVPANRHMPAKPSNNPSLRWEVAMNGRYEQSPRYDGISEF